MKIKVEQRAFLDYLARAYIENQNLIRSADTKANIMLVLTGVVLSVFFNTFITKNLIGGYKISLVLIPFIIGGVFAFSTLYPRRAKANKELSVLYYETVANSSPAKLYEKVKDFSEEEIVKDYLNNTYALSQIIKRKFANVRLSYFFFSLGVIIKLIIEANLWLR